MVEGLRGGRDQGRVRAHAAFSLRAPNFPLSGFLRLMVNISGIGPAGNSSSPERLPSAFFERRNRKDELPRLGVAHIGLGLTCLQLGDLREARTQLELGLSRFEEPCGNIRERFGVDTGAGARAFLAFTLWLSGDLPRVRELIEEGTRLADELGHPPTTATVLMYKIAIETARNDFETVVVDAENFLKISHQHSMGYHLTNSRLYLSLGHARLGNTQREVDNFRECARGISGSRQSARSSWLSWRSCEA